MSLTLQHTEETLPLGHTHPLGHAARAGMIWGIKKVYDFRTSGADGELRQAVERDYRPFLAGHALDFQAKATINWKRTEDASFTIWKPLAK